MGTTMAKGPKYTYSDNNPLNVSRHHVVPFFETEPDTFQNVSDDSPLPVGGDKLASQITLDTVSDTMDQMLAELRLMNELLKGILR